MMYTGHATYYDLGLTSCGGTYTNDDMVCALSLLTMEATLCGRKIRVFSTTSPGLLLTIVDTCPGCTGQYDLDLSPAAFQQLSGGDLAVGRIEVTWEYAD